MDIPKFNKELAYKVAKANGLEKHNRIKEAIEIWLSVSEMALRMSKARNLDFSYKSMLMEKTEQIIAHIKDLKAMISDEEKILPVPVKKVEEEYTILEEEAENPQVNSEVMKSTTDKPKDKQDKIKVIENSDIKNLPIGFKEIKPLKDFKIVTPHNEEYVKEMLNKEVDMSIFKKEKSNDQATPRIGFEPPDDKNKMICFACGSEVPSKSNKCPNCGADLNK